ncbi:uncharacterized protein LOC112689408 [Sipha flava]|uniref:Uncharacterized protein LOC112689408 n=1 Tax=Sipha flava TaxID=143950 RepID=A0A8B8G7Q5_9HEMI|nr:uncharacterized protein LOC112689408 [Sipha flava]
MLGFADDINLVGENKEMIVRNTKTLIQETKKIGLEINEEKTKAMEKLPEIDEEDKKQKYDGTYMSIVKTILTYGCEVWPTAVQIERKLRSFENRVLRTVCRPVFDTEINRAAIEYKPTGKRPRCRPKKRWMDGVQQDLEKLEVTDWEERIQDRDYWRAMTMATKTFTEL